jgi:hypothetical protein
MVIWLNSTWVTLLYRCCNCKYVEDVVVLLPLIFWKEHLTYSVYDEFVGYNLKMLHSHHVSYSWQNFILSLFMNYFNTVAPMVHQSTLPNCKLKTIISRSPCSFTFYKKITFTKIAYFSKIYCHTSFEDPILSSASVASLLQCLKVRD